MIDEEIIKTRLRDIEVYLKELGPILELSTVDIIRDYKQLRVLERDFQLIVDTMIDINTHIISRQNFRSSDDYQSTFEVLGENRVLPMPFALHIAPVVGLRNKVVHKYGAVDKKQFVEDLKKGSSDFREYVKCIEEYRIKNKE